MVLELLLALCIDYSWECDYMGIKSAHLEHVVVRPALTKLSAVNPRLYSEAAVELVMGTAAQESDLWASLTQLSGGPGLGGYQMEPSTHRWLWTGYLSRTENEGLAEILLSMVPASEVLQDENGATYVDDSQLATNLIYSTAITRIRYWVEPEPLAEAGDIQGHAMYWDRHYNANPSAGWPEEFIEKYKRLVAGSD